VVEILWPLAFSVKTSSGTILTPTNQLLAPARLVVGGDDLVGGADLPKSKSDDDRKRG